MKPGFTIKFPGSTQFANGAVIDTKALCRRLWIFPAGKIVLHNLKLKGDWLKEAGFSTDTGDGGG